MSRVLCWLMLLCVGPLSAASITGAVTASDTGGAIETAEVIAFNAFDPSEHVTTFSGADGSFNLTLPAGTYALIAQHPEYSAELYEEQACCSDFSPATPVTVTQDEVRSGVNFTLARGASIAGTVRRRDDATPLANVGVHALANGIAVAATSTDGSGTYSLAVAPGDYVIEAVGDGTLYDQRYPDAQCSTGSCRGEVQTLSVTEGAKLGGIDLRLSPPARLSVPLQSAATGQAIDGRVSWWIVGETGDTPLATDSVGGIAQIELLGSGSIRVAATSPACGVDAATECRAELHPDLPCAHLACNPDDGGAIALATGQQATLAPFVLDAGATIAGHVDGAGTPLAGATVSVYRHEAARHVERGAPVVTTLSDAQGAYRIAGLDADLHYLIADAADFVPELYDDQPCAFNACEIDGGDAVTTTLGDLSADIDFDLPAAGSIAGTVHDAGTQQPLAGVTIHAHLAGSGAEIRSAQSDDSGGYLLSGLPVGEYRLRFSRAQFAGELYDDQPCPGDNCELAAGQIVPVLAATTTGAIDADLVRTDGGDGSTTLIYLDHCKPAGCTVTRGSVNDSRSNRSTITPTGARWLAPFNGSDEVWTQLVACVRDVMGPFRVQVTDVDPGNVPHHEAMIAGLPGQLGFGNGVAGVSPFSCGVIANSISFTFANLAPDDVLELCWTATQEIAHGFGLSHEMYCPDSMTYLSGCGFKRYTDVLADVGTQGACQPAQECQCGITQQNAHQSMLGALGLNPNVFGDSFEDDGTALLRARRELWARQHGAQAFGSCATMDQPADRRLSLPQQ